MARRGTLLGVLLLVLLVGAGGRALWLWLDRPIARVSIRGELHHAGADYLRSRLAPLVQGRTWLSVDLGDAGVRVNSISAGPIKTLAARGISGFNEILKIVEDRAPSPQSRIIVPIDWDGDMQ